MEHAIESCLIRSKKYLKCFSNEEHVYASTFSHFRSKETPRSPPSALKKRLERLESLPESKHPITVYKEDEISKLKSGMPAEDQELANRLQHLKATPNSQQACESISEDEISSRLAKLKGVDVEIIKNPGKGLATKPNDSSKLPKVVQEQNLIKQMSAEVELEKNLPNPDDELATRLAILKGVDVDQIKNPGKGLDEKPISKQSKGPDIDLEQFLSKEGGYSKESNEEMDEKELAKEIDSINKELSDMKKSATGNESKTENTDSSDEEEKEEILAQVIESLKLEDHDPSGDEEDEFKVEEYPW